MAEITILPEAATHHIADGWQLVFVEPTKDKGFTVYLTEPCEGVEGGQWVMTGAGRTRQESIVDLWLALSHEDAKLPAPVVQVLTTHVDMSVAAIAHRLTIPQEATTPG